MNELRICVCNLFPDTKISRRRHAEIAWGREEWEELESLRAGCVEKAKKCVKACVASHAKVRHAFLPHEGG